MKEKAYCYKINLHFLFLAAICHKGGKFPEIWGVFSIFFAGINFRSFNKIEYFAGTNFRDFGQKPRKLILAKISTTKVLLRYCKEIATLLFWVIWACLFFFYLGFVSLTFTNHRTAREGGGHSINSSLPLPPALQTFRH